MSGGTAIWDDDGGERRGAVWVPFLDGYTTTSVGPETVAPRAEFSASSPNPFRTQTTLDYALPTATAVRLSIYDLLGRRVAILVDDVQSAGSHSVIWDGRSDAGRRVASGIYYCRIEAGDVERVRRIVLTR